jgi:L-lactate dehydrogenase complex protein LldG
VSAAREEILGRIRAAIADVPAGEPPAWDPADDPDPAARYEGAERLAVGAPPSAGPADRPDLVPLLAERIAHYRAEVTVAREDEAAAAVGAILARHGATRIAVPADLPRAWIPAGLDLLDDRDPQILDLDEVDGVLTGSAAAIAQTGTIVLDGGPGQGPRRLTLLPDLHVCVVDEDDIAPTVPAAMARLEPAIRAGRPLTLVSGPSATSDIELSRVEGVHGPRTLEVVLLRRAGR